MDWSVVWQLIRDGGTLLLLTVAIIGGWRGWYVWRREYDRTIEQLDQANAERDAWRMIALERRANSDRPGPDDRPGRISSSG